MEVERRGNGGEVHQGLPPDTRTEQEASRPKEQNQSGVGIQSGKEVLESIPAFYDLSISPPTHDFINWLVRAEEYRVKNNANRLDIIIIRGDRDQSPRDKAYSKERRERRIHDLLVPLARLVPTVDKVFVLDKKDVGDKEQKFSYINHTSFKPPVLKAPAVSRSIVWKFLKALKNPVTLTIRQSEFEQIRNSSLDDWRNLARWLKERDFTPVIVPDAESLMVGESPEIDGVQYTPAALSPDLRLALYELSVLNLFTTGGPLVLALYSDIPLMAFKTIIPQLKCCTEGYNYRFRVSPYHDWGPKKFIYWLDDSFDSMTRELEKRLPFFLSSYKPEVDDVFSIKHVKDDA